MGPIAHAQQEDMDQAVSNAQHPDIGILLLINVSVTHHLYGMVKIVYVLHLISYIKEDVQIVQPDTNGKITDANNVGAHINN